MTVWGNVTGPFTLMPSQAPCACSAELWICSHTNPFSVSSKIERSSAPTRSKKRKERERDRTKQKCELIMREILTMMQQAQWNTSKFRYIDAFCQLCLQWRRSEVSHIISFQFSVISCTCSRVKSDWTLKLSYLSYRMCVQPAVV